MSRVILELNKATVAPGLAISCALPVPSGDCFGGGVSGWHDNAFALTIDAVEVEAWKVFRAAADFCVTVTARLRQFAERCRAKFRRTLFQRIKPRAAVLASCLVMRR